MSCIACHRSHDDPNNTCDYEACGTCGFDHAYEPAEANRAHAKLLNGKHVDAMDDMERHAAIQLVRVKKGEFFEGVFVTQV